MSARILPSSSVTERANRIAALKAELASLESDGTSPAADDWFLIGPAAAELNMSEKTLKRKAEKWGFGHNVYGRWQIEMRRARMWRARKPFDPIS